ncbi:hypothetical protein PVAND_014728 [Polypedilum vanderplanki]|uniref:WASH complex subunit CCDC53 n=1 Tax=Polypedilum vanderplanki TaxID=319348 RepID=A0A9J6BA08_POLVA|nr:hypothetical protein PVAND_014728 [Polypedilum vanderplanki]
MALNSKRTQTFFNEFLITTTQFLNQFMNDCENKFFEFERKLNRIESNLVIIEAKLASVPDELPISEPQKTPEQLLSVTQEPQKPQEEQTKQVQEETSIQSQPEPKIENTNMIKISESFLYKKYFKMVKFGVHTQAVKNKMNSEGLDANLLDNPDLMIEKCPEDEEIEE